MSHIPGYSAERSLGSDLGISYAGAPSPEAGGAVVPAAPCCTACFSEFCRKNPKVPYCITCKSICNPRC